MHLVILAPPLPREGVSPLQVRTNVKPKWKPRRTHSPKSVVIKEVVLYKCVVCVLLHSSLCTCFLPLAILFFQSPEPWSALPLTSFRAQVGSSLRVGGTQEVMQCGSPSSLSSPSLHGHSPFSRKGDLSVLLSLRSKFSRQIKTLQRFSLLKSAFLRL